jgi:signal transduction histidine kinase
MVMKTFKHVFIWIFLITHFGFAQSRYDSLTAQLSQASGIQKADILNQLAFEFISHDTIKALRYCRQALSLSTQLHYKKGIGRAYTYTGVYEYLSREFSDGRGNLRRGLNFAIECKDKQNQGYSLFQMGNSFLDQAQLDSSLYFYKKSYQILRDSADPVNLSKLYRNLSTLYGIRSQHELQKQYLMRSARIRELMRNKSLIADVLIVLASININNDDYDRAKENLEKARQMLATVPQDLENLNDWRHQQALVLLHEGKFEQALTLFDSAINYYAAKSLLQKYVTLQTDLGKIFNERGEYEIALQCLYEALKIAELKGFAVEIADINWQLGWANFSLGDLKRSLDLADAALSWVEQNAIPSRVSDALVLKGITLSGLKDFTSAKKCFDTALAIRLKLQDNKKINEAYENLGYMEQNRGNYLVSRDYYLKSLPFAEISGFTYGLVWSLQGLGEVSYKLGEYKLASGYLGEAEKYARQINAKEALIYICLSQRKLLAAQKRFKESLEYAITAYNLHDSLHRSEVGRRFANLQKSDEIRHRDKNIQTLTKEKQLAQEKISMQELSLKQQYYLNIIGTAAIILFAALAVVYGTFYFRVKRLNLAINQQKEELTTQSDYIIELNKNLEGIVVQKTLELQRTNEELIKQNNELLQFSSSVSHKLRGPVARMLGLTTIFRYSKDVAEQNKMLEFVQKASQDLDSTLKDLSKIIDIKNDLHNSKEWVNLEEEWVKSCDLLKDAIKEQFTISHDFENVPEVFTIKAIVQSVFYNLLSNAIKYRSDERNLIVGAKSFIENSQLVIEVSDNGLGIDVQKHKDSLFKLFKRFHTHVEGRGLGLYLIKSQIEALNGSLEIYSVVGQGSCFRATFADMQVIPSIVLSTERDN